ncbi:UDP-N-acetylmuramoyl-tripeptide--D-alanyl-D-alanine ligase [Marinobacterium jannaschii]|uniref:UDP-N-acetylmuramoyl-tripeptide--D-alanyl-D- alanine ligase n=1 Tax=Marinobacterium jannaschii TaxID=64970 RepID=UPI0004867F72|nr:UDP-N-acetylmuramoyl-tripeptide--D-alanyl-D-alanine ligase [Marinobacterium jannaschii]
MIGEWNLSLLQQNFGGELNCDDGRQVKFTGISTDTRQLQPGQLFIALQGPNFDGNRFVAQALEKGAAAAVVTKLQDSDIAQWCVADTRIALGQLANLNRQRFDGPLISVTGSSGKTTVKEMLASILGQVQPVLATRGNFNNDIGAPLTLLEIGAQHHAAVIELGASAEGEIDYTARLAAPQIAILNNAMGAHLEGFGSLMGVVRAKAEIFDGLQKDGVAVINRDDPHADHWLKKVASLAVRVMTFARDRADADVTALDLQAQNNGCYRFQLCLNGERRELALQVMGRHNVANALAAATAASACGIAVDQIVTGLQRFCAVSGRMRRYRGAQGALLIDDSYNANPGSVRAAIDLLTELGGERVLVLGDMGELGEGAAEEHSAIGAYAAQKGIDRVFAVGELSALSVAEFKQYGGDGRHFKTKKALIETLESVLGKTVTVLVKGSRSAGMEIIIKALQEGETN